jgi:hypothetical protein
MFSCVLEDGKEALTIMVPHALRQLAEPAPSCLPSAATFPASPSVIMARERIDFVLVM